MNTFLSVLGSAMLVVGLIICQLGRFKKKHPNAELLAHFYHMITPKASGIDYNQKRSVELISTQFRGKQP
jgi:hypothetical protein